jgi:RHS repeat-associated protein
MQRPQSIFKRLRSARSAIHQSKKRSTTRQHLLEHLEDRRLLTVAAAPDQALSISNETGFIAPGFFNPGTTSDLVSVSRSGAIDVSSNGNDNTWLQTRTSSPVAGPVLGAETALLNADAFDDLILQTSSSIEVLHSDGIGGWQTYQSVAYAGVSQATTHPLVQPATGYLAGDFAPDLFIPLTQSNQIAVFVGDGAAGFAAPIYLNSGGSQPVSVAVGDVVGSPETDLVVGHLDGTLSIFEGGNGGSLTLRSDLTGPAGVGSVTSVEIQDLDRDGQSEVVVLGSRGATILTSNADPLAASPIVNGSFDAGLSGWTVDAIGQKPGEQPGRVNANPGFAQFTENQSFLTSLSQSFKIPASPQTIEFELRALGLDANNADEIPDAFQVSLLDAHSGSLVPTHRSDSTAFVNYVSGELPSLSPNVAIHGTTIILDISALAPGTDATLIFDLIGNPKGTSSTATIDRVRITPDLVLDDGFTTTPLAGPFTAPQDLAIGDVDGDGFFDIVISDAGQTAVIVFNGDGSGSFTRNPVNISRFGAPTVLALGPFTAPDSILDIAVGIAGQSTIITPLVSDTTVPSVQLIAPSGGAPIKLTATDSAVAALGSIVLEFSEPMFAPSPTTNGSASNPSAYSVYNYGPDGMDNGGVGDDVLFTVTSAAYNSNTQQVTLSLGGAQLSDPTLAAGSLYAIVARGADPADGLRDLVGNLLDGGQNAVSVVVLDRTPTLTGVTSRTIDEGVSTNLSTTLTHNSFDKNYMATVNWGDGSTVQILGSDTFPSENFIATHTYADNGVYQVTVTVEDGLGVVAHESATVTVINVNPTVMSSVPITASEGVSQAFTLATFTDPGYSRDLAGSRETFTATIDWKDGSPIETVTIIATHGGPGVATSGVVTATHTYVNDGTYTPSVRVTDDDGGSNQAHPQITVSNTAPTPTNPVALAGDEGSELTLSFAATDPGLVDTLTASINWGDGATSSISGVFDGALWQFEAAHRFPDNGTYDVLATISDGTDSVTATTTATINSVAPTITAANAIGTVNELFTLSTVQVADAGFSMGGTAETFTATVDWGDGSSPESATIVNLVPGSAGVPTTANVTGSHTYSAPGAYNVSVTVTDDDGAASTKTFVVAMNSSTGGGKAWLPTIDFERDALGNALSTGEIVAEQWSSWGVHVTSHDPINHPPMIFDSAYPTGQDTDLGSPNSDFGGPGIGSGGASGSNAANDEYFGRILIISEDADATDPDDRAAGGTLIFSFDNLVMIDDIRLLDVDQNETATFRTFNANGVLISTMLIAGAGDNGQQTAAINAVGVARLEVEFSGSGAIADLIFCRDFPAGESIFIAGAAHSLEGDAYTLDLQSAGFVVDGWTVNWGDGNIERFGPGDATISHVFDDGPRTASIYATARSGEDVLAARALVVDVQNVVPTLTIAGTASVAVGDVYVLDLSVVEPGQDTIESWLINWGDGSEFELFTGNPLQVSHTYERSGTFYVQAHARDEDYSGPHDATASLLEFAVLGSEGFETFDLLIDDQVVESYTASTAWQNFSYSASQTLAPNQVKIQFTNDYYDPANGIDRNLQVDYIKIDGETFQTEDPSVYSTGTWKPEDGIASGYRESEWLHSDGYFQYAGNAPSNGNPFLTKWVSNALEVTVAPDPNVWIPTIDFEFSGNGQRLKAGERITNQFADLGVTISTNKPHKPAMIFNSSHPTGGDSDLGSPHQNFGGPGRGSGGGAGAGANSQSLRNVLIISEDNDASDPDDNASGGTLIFDFDTTIMMDEVHLLDIDSSNTHIKLYAADGSLISDTYAQNLGDNSFQIVQLNATGVAKMEIIFDGSGAVAAVVSCRAGMPIQAAPTRFFVVDTNDTTFRYSPSGSDVGEFSLASQIKPRGAATTGEGNPIWVVSEEGSNERVYVYDTDGETLLGNWTAKGLSDPHGIATDGTDIWIVDDGTNKVQRYAGAAARLSGAQYKADYFHLSYGNSKPRGITTDGNYIWVVDGGKDKVFVYDMAGNWINWWKLDHDNSNPTGLTISTDGGDNIWVVDATDDRVYVYDHRTLSHQGSQPAIASWDLAPSNKNPQGIADPSQSISIGDTITETLTAGDTFDWTFTANAGDEIFTVFSSMTGAAFFNTVSTTLFAPSGAVVYSKSDFRYFLLTSGPHVLTETGTYTLLMNSNANIAFSFTLHGVPAPDITTNINFQQIYTGNIESPGAKDQYTFFGTAGSEVFFDATALSGSSTGGAVVQFVDPNGTTISSRSASRVASLDHRVQIPTDGIYTIIVSGVGADRPTYGFQAVEIPPPDIFPLTYEEVAEGELEVAGAVDRWIFDGTTGDNLFLDFFTVNGGDLQVIVNAPSGATVFNTSFSREYGLDNEFVLSETGPYTITLQAAFGSAGVFDYSFRLWEIPSLVPQVGVLNSPLNGTLVPGEHQIFAIDIPADTEILFDALDSASGGLALQLQAPDGTFVTGREVNDRIVSLTQGGTYQAIIQRVADDPLAGDNRGSYSFRLQDITYRPGGALDSLGTRFFVGFQRNLLPLFGGSPDLSITITSAVDTSGAVIIPGFSTSYLTYDVNAGESTTIDLSGVGTILLNGRTENRGVIVTAVDEVAVYGLNQFTDSTDGFTALPIDTLGTDYRVMAYPNTVQLLGDGGSTLAVVATEDNTLVTITPADSAGPNLAGVPFTITLNKAQLYQLYASAANANGGANLHDLTGTTITSTAPIAVYGGNTAAYVPTGFGAADHLVEQMTPVQTWGTQFLTTPLATRSGGDTLRILAHQDNTEVRINGTLVATLNAGQVHEQIVTDASYVVTSHPALVAQLAHGSTFDGATGDPLMMLVPPFEQYQNAYTMTTPSAGINSNFANLIVPATAVGWVQLDGQPIPATEYSPIGNSGFSAAALPISVGSHNFSSPQPIGVSIYGFDGFDSYGYFGGMSLAPVAQVSTLTLEPASIQAPLNSQTTITAAIVDAMGSGLSGIRVDFAITGTNPGNYFAFTDANGRASIQYTGNNPGLDTVTASTVGLTALGIVTWLAAPPIVSVQQPTAGSSLAVGNYLLQGSAAAQLPGGFIVEARVNGRPVDALDPTGNFFASIHVLPGSQTIQVEVVDSFGQTATTSVPFEGQAPTGDPADPLTTRDVTASAQLRYSGTTFNRQTRQLSVDMQVVSSGNQILDPTIAARLDATGAPLATLSNPDGFATTGRPLVLFDSEVPTSGLIPGASSGVTRLRFDNPLKDRFTPDFTLLAAANQAPAFASIPRLQAILGQAYRYDPLANDANLGQTLTYALTASPELMTIDSATGQINWTPAAADEGTHAITLAVSDGRGGTAAQSFDLAVIPAPPNRPPVITSVPVVSLAPDANYLYAVVATDVDGDGLNYSLASAPTGMTVEASTGLISFPTAPAGIYPIVVQVSDNRGGISTQSFVLNVGFGAGVGAPLITSTPVVTAIVDALYVYAVAAEDPTASNLTYSLNTAPSGMRIDASTGRITWQPELQDLGNAGVQVQVSNALGGITLQTYGLETITARPNLAPVFITQALRVATVDQTYSYAAQAQDDPTQTLTYNLLAAPVGMQVDSATGLLTWTPSLGDLGSHRVLLTATDPLGAAGFLQFYVDVRDVNLPPEFTSQPIATIQAGDLYRYNALAIDSNDSVTYQLLVAPIGNGGMQIDRRGGSITWQPGLVEVGDHTVIVRATDERGLSVEQTYTLSVLPDTKSPRVDIVLSASRAAIGQLVNISVQAADNVGIDTLELFNGTTPISLNNGQATFSSSASGYIFLTAVASDASGNTASTSATLQIGDLVDDTPPVVVINSPSANATITYLTDVFATVTDANLKSYKLEYTRLNDDTWKTITEVTLTDGTPIDVINANLGTFDPTMLVNDEYQLRLTAEDLAGNTAFAFATLSLDGQAKLGNFRLEFTDLNIPLAGIPIQINRVYDTLESDESMDFGFGWKLDIASPRIRETIRVSQAEAAGAGIFGANPFRVGTRVYLTTPDGRRVGFTFDPIVAPGLLGAIWRPRFTPDPGVYHQLEVENIPLSQASDGTFGLYLTGFAYNPDTYTLTTKDQLRYTYNQFDEIQLQSIVDRNGVRLSIDAFGIHSSIGPEVKWDRDAEGRIALITDPAGNQIAYSYTAAGDLASLKNQIDEVTRMTYLSDPPHYVESMTDPRGLQILKLGYDDQGRLTSQGDALSNSTMQTYDLANNTEVIADRLGNETTLVFDARGNVTEERDPLGFSTFFAYDENDNETLVTNKRGFATTFEYDSRGNVTKVTDASGGETTTTYNARNDVTSIMDSLGRLTQFRYDASGNLREIINAAGDSELRTFDSEGRVLSLTDKNGNVNKFEYSTFCSCAGSPSKVILPGGSSQHFTYNIFSQVTSATDELGYTTTLTYDNIGQLLTVIEPNGQIQTNEYNANKLVKQKLRINAMEERVIELFYDGNNNLIRGLSAIGAETLFTYDAADNLTTITDPENNTTTFILDDLQRVQTKRDPFGNDTVFSFDPNGNTSQIIDRNGRIREFIYDELDRLTSEIWRDATGIVVDTVSSTYDAVDNRLTTSDGDTSYSWTYDVLNRAISESNVGSTGVPGLTLHWEYDKKGNRTAVFDNYGVRVDSHYSTRDELLSKTWTGLGSGGLRIDFDYNERSERISATRFSDALKVTAVGNSTFTFDESGRDRAISHEDANDQVIASFDYAYDFANQLVSETNRGEQIVYSYDLAGQLTTADRAVYANESYSYDLNANRLSSHLQPSGTTIGANNQLLADGAFSYEYDMEGNLIRRTSLGDFSFTEYDYDHRNRLAVMTEKDATGTLTRQSSYRYDVLGRRIEATTDGDTIVTLYDGDNAWLDADGAGTIATHYLFGDAIDENLARHTANAGFAWYLADKLGTVTNVVDLSHSSVASASFDSYGNALSTTNDSLLDRYAFAGRELDTSGLYHNRARAYNAATGVFVQQDPLGIAGGASNFYQYAMNHPTGIVDPTGLLAVTEYRPAIVNFATNFGAGVAGCVLGDLIEISAGFGDEGPTLFGSILFLVQGKLKLPSKESLAETGINKSIAIILTTIFVGVGKAGDASLRGLPLGGTAGIAFFASAYTCAAI